MTGTLRRIAVMTGLNTRRTFSSFGNWLWILIVPIAFSLILGFFFLDSESQAPAVERGEHAAAEVSLETPAAQSLSDAQRQTAIVVYASPRGDTDESGLVRLRMTFAVYMVFAFAALFSRSGALHQEYAEGTLQRTVAGGVAYGEIVAAHVAAVFLVGLVQAAVVVTLTSLLGTPWLMAGWGVLALTIGGTLLVAAGLAIGLSGLTRSATVMQGLSGSLPPLLGMMGGAFFPLEAAPAGLQQAARVNPVYWTMELLAEGYVYRGAAGQMMPLAVLVLIGILGAVIGIQGLRRVEM